MSSHNKGHASQNLTGDLRQRSSARALHFATRGVRNERCEGGEGGWEADREAHVDSAVLDRRVALALGITLASATRPRMVAACSMGPWRADFECYRKRWAGTRVIRVCRCRKEGPA